MTTELIPAMTRLIELATIACKHDEEDEIKERDLADIAAAKGVTEGLHTGLPLTPDSRTILDRLVEVAEHGIYFDQDDECNRIDKETIRVAKEVLAA